MTTAGALALTGGCFLAFAIVHGVASLEAPTRRAYRLRVVGWVLCLIGLAIIAAAGWVDAL